ncbi:hypothetical protein ABS815_19860 [Klebsiella pneumoniae]
MSNAINPNQMNIYNDIRKAKENHVNSSLKRLIKHVFCPKCNIQVRAANLEKHLAKHEVNPLMMPKIPHPPQPVRSPRKMKPPVIEIKKNAVKSSAVLRDNAEKSVSGWADKINRTGAELRALYEGKQLPKHKAEIRKAKILPYSATFTCMKGMTVIVLMWEEAAIKDDVIEYDIAFNIIYIMRTYVVVAKLRCPSLTK